MWWICGAIVGTVVVVWLWGACIAAGRSDDAMERARRREAAKHELDLQWWSLLDDAALAGARDGECTP